VLPTGLTVYQWLLCCGGLELVICLLPASCATGIVGITIHAPVQIWHSSLCQTQNWQGSERRDCANKQKKNVRTERRLLPKHRQWVSEHNNRLSLALLMWKSCAYAVVLLECGEPMLCLHMSDWWHFHTLCVRAESRWHSVHQWCMFSVPLHFVCDYENETSLGDISAQDCNSRETWGAKASISWSYWDNYISVWSLHSTPRLPRYTSITSAEVIGLRFSVHRRMYIGYEVIAS